METLFTPLPQDFEKLAAAASVKRSSNFGKDPDLRTVGERTYQAFAVVQFSPLSDAHANAIGDIFPMPCG